MSRIYISSSWRNGAQPTLVKELERRGHQVYDFRHPSGRNDHNVWEEVTSSMGLSPAYTFHRYPMQPIIVFKSILQPCRMPTPAFSFFPVGVPPTWKLATWQVWASVSL